MINRTKRHIWPVALVAVLAVAGLMAVLIVLASPPGTAQAQGLCDTASGPTLEALIAAGVCTAPDDGMDPVIDNGTDDTAATGPATIENSSTSASASVELRVVIDMLPINARAGSSVELYLEDDFKVPNSIDRDTVYFTVDSDEARVNGGGRVYAADPIDIDDDDHFGGDDDWSIRVFIPDMDTSDTEDGAGYNGPLMGEEVTLVFTKAAGIMNPSEEGTHSVGFSVLDEDGDANDGPMYSTHKGQMGVAAIQTSNTMVMPAMNADTEDARTADVGLKTLAKIALDDDDNVRGFDLTVTGSGFNNGVTADVYVLSGNDVVWDTLDCAQMNLAAGSSDTMGNGFCRMYADLTAAEKDAVDALDFSDNPAEAAVCAGIIAEGANPGNGTVGSDDKIAITFEVTVPTFMRGDQNYICMVDGEGRASTSDVEKFKLEPSIRVVPSTVSAGDTVNVFAQDFPTDSAVFEYVKLANKNVEDHNGGEVRERSSIGVDGSATATFVVPGGLKGTIRLDAAWGDTKEDAKIVISPSALLLSKDEVSANENVTIRGTGFGDGKGYLVSAQISGADLVLVSEDDVDSVEVSSAGQFAVTVAIWSNGASNPALTPGTHTIEVEDNDGFVGTAEIVIKEPTLTVIPDVAGPRDYVTISGTNWPVENDDGGRIDEVEIAIGTGDNADDEDADPDASGRWSVTYRVSRDVAIPSTQQVKASYGAGSEIVKIGTFSVPQANLMVTPELASPGDTISLSATGFSLFESKISVKIGSVTVNVPDGTVTDRDGAIGGLEVIVPSLDAALYTVQLTVGDTVTIGELTVVEETAAGVPAPLPGAMEELGDTLVRVFYFNGVDKAWSFFDPRPDFADLNTLTEMIDGQPYWILVSEGVDDVVLNNMSRTLTCVGGDCWNQIVW